VLRAGLWERFEEKVANSKYYQDPIRDVELKISYDRPDGSEVPFWGFYDGEQTWRVRFMPDHIGRWRYRARFSDGTSGPAGEFECVDSETPGPLEAHRANPVWFAHRGGDVLLMRSLHVGDRFFAANWNQGSRTAFLDWAQRQGYNTLSVASCLLNRNVEGRGAACRSSPRIT